MNDIISCSKFSYEFFKMVSFVISSQNFDCGLKKGFLPYMIALKDFCDFRLFSEMIKPKTLLFDPQ